MTSDPEKPADTDSTIPDALRPFIVEQPCEHELIDVSEAARRLDVSPTTVQEWVRSGTLLGWMGMSGNLWIPAEQIVAPGRVLPGMSTLLKIIDEPEVTWQFLTTEWPFAELFQVASNPAARNE